MAESGPLCHEVVPRIDEGPARRLFFEKTKGLIEALDADSPDPDPSPGQPRESQPGADDLAGQSKASARKVEDFGVSVPIRG